MSGTVDYVPILCSINSSLDEKHEAIPVELVLTSAIQKLDYYTAQSAIADECNRLYGYTRFNASIYCYVGSSSNFSMYEMSMVDSCISLSFIEYQKQDPNSYEKEMIFENNVNNIFFVALVVFGLFGMICSFLLITMVLSNKHFRSIPYSILCVFQAIADFVMFFEFGVIEGYRDIKYMLTKDDSFIVIRGIAYSFDNGQYFLATSSLCIAILLRLLKAGNRLVALFIPFSYDIYFSMKRTLLMCFAIYIVIIMATLPIVILRVECGVMFSMGIYIFNTNCSDFYNNGSFYFEAGVALTCFIIDFMTAIKFYFISKKNKKNDSLLKQQQRKEKIFLIQNLANLSSFTIGLVPYLIFTYLCNQSDYYQSCFNHKIYAFLHTFLRYPTKWVVGHFFDE